MSDQTNLSIWPVAQQIASAQRKGRYAPESTAHPGKMLPAIARHAINAFTQPGDIVADPMCGIGTTLVEAIHLGRNAVGVEYEQRWTDVANQNVDLARSQGATGSAIGHCGDGRDITRLVDPSLVGKVALVITSPPYGPSLHGQVRASNSAPVNNWDKSYSDDKTNLGHASTPELLDAFGEILSSCRELLRVNGTVVVTTRPWRENGELVDLPSAVMRLGKSVGLTPYERNVALLCGIRDGALISRASFFQLNYVRKARERSAPLAVIAHEDVIVFKRTQA